MKIARIVNETKTTVVCPKCIVADNFWTRGKGLLGRASLPEDEGILLIPGTSIHMFGMKFAIDVVFLTKENVVTDLVENIAPGKAFVAKNHAGRPHCALEVPVGTITRSQVEIGDQLARELL